MRRVLRSLGEGGERLQRIPQDTPQLAAGELHLYACIVDQGAFWSLLDRLCVIGLTYARGQSVLRAQEESAYL